VVVWATVMSPAVTSRNTVAVNITFTAPVTRTVVATGEVKVAPGTESACAAASRPAARFASTASSEV
jgi:hypothetical protein